MVVPFLRPLFFRLELRIIGAIQRSGLITIVQNIYNRQANNAALLALLDSRTTLIEARVAAGNEMIQQCCQMLSAVHEMPLHLAPMEARLSDGTRMHLAPVEARLIDLARRLENSNRDIQSQLSQIDKGLDASAQAVAAQGMGIQALPGHLDRIQAEVATQSLELQALPGHLGRIQAGINQSLGRQVIYLADGFVAIRTPLEWVLLPNEEAAFIAHFANGFSLHEPGTIGVIQKVLAPGDIALDVGAHVGLLTIPMARSVGLTGRVLAIEPVTRSIDALRLATQLNDVWRQVEIVQGAIADKAGASEFYLGANSMLGSVAINSETGEGYEVKTFTIDDVTQHLPRVDVVKLDIEGAELLALAGMGELIARSPKLMIVAEFTPAHLRKMNVTPEDWFGKFSDHGFKFSYAISETSGVCTPIDDIASLRETVSVNVVFCQSAERASVLPMTS